MATTIRGAVGHRLEVPDLIAAEALHRLRNQLLIPRLGQFTYEKYFESQIGNTITVKRPYKAKAQTGRTLVVDKLIDRSVEISVDKRFHFGLKVNDEERTFDITAFGDRYMQAGVEEIADHFDEEGGKELVYGSFFSHGTLGNALTSKTAAEIRAHAVEYAIPRNMRNWALINPLDLVGLHDDLKSLDLPPMVSEVIRQRFMGRLSGFSVFESVHLPYIEIADYMSSTPLVNGVNEQGDEIDTDGWANSIKVLNKGQLFTIAGVETIQPLGSRRTLGRLQTFTVLEDVTSSGTGTATIKIAPEINDGTLTATDGTGAAVALAAYQTVDARPADNAAITVLGTKGKRYRQGVFFEGGALEYVPVKLKKIESNLRAGDVTDPMTGLNLTFHQGGAIEGLTETSRIDTMFGVKNVYAELCIRFLGPEV